MTTSLARTEPQLLMGGYTKKQHRFSQRLGARYNFRHEVTYDKSTLETNAHSTSWHVQVISGSLASVINAV